MSQRKAYELVFNFSPIASGGGLQNACSLITTLGASGRKMSDFCAVVRAGSVLSTLCREIGVATVPVQASLLGRWATERFCRRKFLHGQTCFTLFGPPLAGSQNYLLNVNGCAYSNLFYPEIEFWSYLRGFSRFKKESIDLYRKRTIARADYWIFETETLQRRAVELHGFPRHRVGVVRMAPSQLVHADTVQATLADRYQQAIPPGFRYLFLNGAHPNKRMHTLPQIAEAMHRRGLSEFCFVTTMPQEHAYTRAIADQFSSRGLSKVFHNLGPIPSANVSSLISAIDCICTFSVLESFSNNFVEAWKMLRPLVVTDADWSRDACGEGALYVDPENAESTADAFATLMQSETTRTSLVAAAEGQLARHPDASTKLEHYFREIEVAKRLGSCPQSERNEICWPKPIFNSRSAA